MAQSGQTLISAQWASAAVSRTPMTSSGDPNAMSIGSGAGYKTVPRVRTGKPKPKNIKKFEKIKTTGL